MLADSPSPVLVPEAYEPASSDSQKKMKEPNKEKQHDDISDHLPYELGYLPENFRQMAERELGETEERKQTALTKFRQRIAAEKNLYVRTDDLCLLAYLRGKKYDVDRAFKSMENTYKLRMKRKIYDLDDNSIAHEVFRENWIGFLPYRAKDGSVILVIKLGMWNTDKVDRDLLMWVITHCMIHSIEDEATQVAGYSTIIDVRGINSKHLKQITIENILLTIHSTQDCFPGRYKALHIVGMPKLFAYAWNICCPFLFSYKMRKRLIIHGEDLKNLHKYISPSILPEEFNGELGPFDNSGWHASILKRNDWALEQRFYGYKK